MKRSNERASGFRALAAEARERATTALLPRVREIQERAAVTWDGLADLEDAMLKAAAQRTAALERTAATPA